MAEQDPNREEENPQAPASLVEALNHLQKEPLSVPPALDEIVLRKAREHLQKFERPEFGRKRWVSWVAWAAIAACLAMAAWLAERFHRPQDDSPLSREDVNRDGRVDILDAFVLARQIETGGTLDPRWDINGDGRIDRGDVKAIAARAVSLAIRSSTKRAEDNRQPFRTGARTALSARSRGQASVYAKRPVATPEARLLPRCNFLLPESRTTIPSGLGGGLVPPADERRDCS